MINIAGELFSKDQIAEKVKELAKEIENYFGDEDIVAVCILKGASVFAVDLNKK